MIKKITVPLAAFILIFMLASCGATDIGGDGDYISYITKNNLTVESYEPEVFLKDKKEKDHFYSLRLTGLLNDNVSSEIEAAITDAVGDFRDAPAPSYDGIKMFTDGEPTGITISTKAKGCINNIFSVLLTKNVYYKNGTWTDTRTLNFDLRSGKLISFEDMFCRESKPGKALSEKCNAYLEENRLLKKDEKPEYTKNQKYYLDLDGIHVIYDYATGGINIKDFKPVEAVVPFNSVCGSIDIEKYVTKENLFEDATVVNILLPSGSELEETENNIPDRTNLAMIQYLSWPVDIPDKILKAFMKDAEVVEAELDNVNKTVMAGRGVYHYKDMANCEKMGSYYNIVRSKSLFGSRIFTENKTCSVYDKSGTRLELGDVFKEGIEYEKIIKKALKESLANYYEDDSYAGKTLDEIYGGLSFYLDSTGIVLWTEGLSLKNENGDKHESPVSFFIEYEKLGCENLTIFN